MTLPVTKDRPSGKRFGRVVHSILQHAESIDEITSLAQIWGRRHGASEEERTAAAEVARTALSHILREVPLGAERHRELPIMVRLGDGTIVEGRIDFAWCDGNTWSVVDYKTDRRENRNFTQLQLYGLALHRSTGLPVRGIVLEV